MCVIIEKPVGHRLNKEKLYSAAYTNDDGLGLMYIHPETGELVAEKYFFKTFHEYQKKIDELFDVLLNVHAFFHLRYSTHGTTDINNVHPFQILSKAEHGVDVYLMHNGMINIESKAKRDKDKSDTALFAEYIVKPILARDPTLLYTHAFQQLVDSYAGGSRLLFLDSHGVVVRTGEWKTNENCIVSNNSYFDGWYSGGSRNYAGRYNNGWSSYYDNNTWEGYGSKDKGKPAGDTSSNTTPFKPSESEDKKKEQSKEANTPTNTMDGGGTGDDLADDSEFELVQVGYEAKRGADITVDDLSRMDEESLQELCEYHPDTAASLFVEILATLYAYTYSVDRNGCC